jgi:hypothetical protein
MGVGSGVSSSTVVTAGAKKEGVGVGWACGPDAPEAAPSDSTGAMKLGGATALLGIFVLGTVCEDAD